MEAVGEQTIEGTQVFLAIFKV